MESQEQIDNANLLLTQHRLKLEWNQMVWSVNNLRCGTTGAEQGQSIQAVAVHGKLQGKEVEHFADEEQRTDERPVK